jgi:hypothetical protein
MTPRPQSSLGKRKANSSTSPSSHDTSANSASTTSAALSNKTLSTSTNKRTKRSPSCFEPVNVPFYEEQTLQFALHVFGERGVSQLIAKYHKDLLQTNISTRLETLVNILGSCHRWTRQRQHELLEMKDYLKWYTYNPVVLTRVYQTLDQIAFQSSEMRPMIVHVLFPSVLTTLEQHTESEELFTSFVILLSSLFRPSPAELEDNAVFVSEWRSDMIEQVLEQEWMERLLQSPGSMQASRSGAVRAATTAAAATTCACGCQRRIDQHDRERIPLLFAAVIGFIYLNLHHRPHNRFAHLAPRFFDTFMRHRPHVDQWMARQPVENEEARQIRRNVLHVQRRRRHNDSMRLRGL